MKILKGTFLIWVLLQAGCSSVPVVHVYAKYLSAAQIKQLKMSLTSSGEYRVVTNDFNFPASITENTMIYPIILEDPAVIDDVAELVSSAGHTVENFQAMTKGNHWYTNNTLALFIYPEISVEKNWILWQDLIGDYLGQECGDFNRLELKKNGSFVLRTEKASDKLRKEDYHNSQIVEERWKYRQYPFIELQSDSANYAEYYFEIKRYTGVDKVSELEFTELASLNDETLPDTCAFISGVRK